MILINDDVAVTALSAVVVWRAYYYCAAIRRKKINRSRLHYLRWGPGAIKSLFLISRWYYDNGYYRSHMGNIILRRLYQSTYYLVQTRPLVALHSCTAVIRTFPVGRTNFIILGWFFCRIYRETVKKKWWNMYRYIFNLVFVSLQFNRWQILSITFYLHAFTLLSRVRIVVAVHVRIIFASRMEIGMSSK